jgi:tripartite-type tricarboxylate transporter receptor subunit TctC
MPEEKMLRFNRRAALLAAMCVAVQLFAPSAVAQAFPNKPIKLIVPWPPGGSTDVTMRVLAEATAKHLGQPIVVENKPGAGGTLGVTALQSAKNDGYTITQVPLGVFRLPFTTTVTYDPMKDITYVIGISGYTFGTVVPADSPFKSMKDMADYAKANPGKLTWGSTGIGTAPHLMMEEWALNEGLQMNHIPYKGSADQMAALLGNHVMAGADATGFGPHVDAGKLRLLATWGERRTKRWPQVGTMKDLGYGIVSNSPYGIGAPKDTDPAIVKVLHDAFKKGMEDAAHLAIMDKYDQELLYMSSADYARFARETMEKERKLLEKLGLTKK